MPYITLRDGQRMFVRVIGQGQPCVLLHGFAMHSLHWLTSIMPLQRRYKFFLPDFRGFGQSQMLRYSQADVLADLADDVEDLMHWIGEDVPVAGISMGACVAMRYHERHKFAGITRYLHIDQSPKIRNNDAWQYGLFGEKNDTMMLAFEDVLVRAQPYIDAGARYDEVPEPLLASFWMLASTFFEAAISEHYQKRMASTLMSMNWFRKFMLPLDNWQAYLACMSAYARQDYDMRESMRTLPVPLTVAIGMKSHMYPARGQMWLADNVPGAKVVRFEKSGHTIPLTEPIKFVKLLDGFIGDQPNKLASR